MWVEVGARKHERVLWNTQEWLGMVDSGQKRVKTWDKTLKTVKVVRNVEKYRKYSKMSKTS